MAEIGVRVLGFAGSLRTGSYNRALLNAAVDLAPAAVSIEVFDLSPIPLFNADLQAEGDPAPVARFKERIAAVDALLIATPEYNYSIPGVLKNSIDWASRPIASSPLDGKPVALMGVGGRMGTVRSQLHLRQVAVYVNMLPLNRPEVVLSDGAAKFDEAGRLIDPDTADRVRRLLEALAEWTLRLRGGAA